MEEEVEGRCARRFFEFGSASRVGGMAKNVFKLAKVVAVDELVVDLVVNKQ